NTWSWKGTAKNCGLQIADLRLQDAIGIEVKHDELGTYQLLAEGAPTLLFCDNETNTQRLFHVNGVAGYFKDAFHDYVVHGRDDAVNPNRVGTKAAAYYQLQVPPHGSVRIRLRLTKESPGDPFFAFDDVLQKRRSDADAFYAE